MCLNRELAFQIHDQFVALGSAINLKSVVIVGGLDMMDQAVSLAQRPHIIIATPGRLCDLIKSSSSEGQWNLSRIKFLVLDEADRLLSHTFAEELGFIIEQVPIKRQTLLFTATVTEAIMRLKEKEPAQGKERPFLHLSDQEWVMFKLDNCKHSFIYYSDYRITTPSSLQQYFIFFSSQVRECYTYYLLLHLCQLTGAKALIKPPKSTEDEKNSRRRQRDVFKKRNPTTTHSDSEDDEAPKLPQTILFVSRCRTAAHLSILLDELDIPNTPLHSHLSQRERLASLNSFRASRVPLLIATDVGSRGLDIPEVEVIINWDVPRNPDDYVHRVGRTARAGKRGTSITLVTEGDVDLVGAVEDRTGVVMEEMVVPEDEVLEGLNRVMTAKRVATMTLHEEKFGERQETRKKKAGMLLKDERRIKRKSKSRLDA